MKITPYLILLPVLLASELHSQVRDQPKPAPTPGPAVGGIGVPGIPAGGRLGPDNPGRAVPGGVGPGLPGGSGGFPGLPAGGGAGMGGPPMMGGGMPMFDPSAPNRFELMSMQFVPTGKNEPQPIILKLDTQTGQVWMLQAQSGQPGVRFVMVPQQGGMQQPGFGAMPQPDVPGGAPFNPPRPPRR